MDPNLLRSIGALVLGVIMAVLALGTRGQPYRRMAMGLGALSLVLLAVYNAGTVYNYDGQLFSIVAMVLLAAALVCYLLSWRKGEVLQRHEQLRREMAAKIQERKQATEQPPADQP